MKKSPNEGARRGKRAGLPLRDDLPVVGVSRLRATGVIKLGDETVRVMFGELEREVRVTHRLFPNGGSWSFFLCPTCSRRVRNLRLYDGRVVCGWCDGLLNSAQVGDKAGVIERLRQRLSVTKKNRANLERSLRRAIIVERRTRLGHE